MTTTPPNLGDVPRPERDLGAPYDHERAAKEFLDAADRSTRKPMLVPSRLTST